ncbi:MAG: ATP-binding region, ATPase domain protein [Aeromicrobium sp.]|nr:ATP-binding region, ATPase domain protein [Aeromicrobium sp.]
MRSLRARILALGVGSAAAVLVLLSVPVALTLERDARDETEQDAVTTAQGVADFISGSAQRADVAPLVDRVNERGNDTPVTVALADGTILGAQQPSCTADATGTAEDGDGDGDGRRGGGRRGRGEGGLRPTSQATVIDVSGGHLVRIAASDESGNVAVCALVDDGQVRDSVLSRLAILGGAAAAVLLTVAVIALLVARRLARHLIDTAATADRLSDGDLTARVAEGGPVEVRRVGAALNRLAGRIDELLTLERETVADLSHRLRTPMMAVRLDVESLPGSAAKAELEDHLAQLERTLTAVIQAARRPQREGAAPHADVLGVVTERFDYWAPLFEDQGRASALRLSTSWPPDPGGEPPSVRCAREDLAAALDALLENSVAHTPEGAAIEVVVEPADNGWVQLDVRDQGPGVPPAALRRGQSDRGSTGLGLDIARACAEATGGLIELGTDGDWSYVRLLLGPA